MISLEQKYKKLQSRYKKARKILKDVAYCRTHTHNGIPLVDPQEIAQVGLDSLDGKKKEERKIKPKIRRMKIGT